MHSVKTALPAGEFEYTGHDWHVELVEAPFPSEYEFDGQAVHDASAVCPVATPYLPAPQSVQSPFLTADLYFPFPHTAQLPPIVSALPE